MASSSSSSSTIQVKSYFNSNDLRRFELELLPTGVYQRLLEHLLTVYTDLNTTQLHLCWLDDEKELIGFASDAELEYAIKYQIKLHGQKKNMCFSKNKNMEPLLKVHVFTQRFTDSKTVNDPPKGNSIGQKISGLIKKVGSEEIALQARKSISRDLKHLRTQNVNLLRPKKKTKSFKETPAVKSEQEEVTEDKEVKEVKEVVNVEQVSRRVSLSGEEQLKEEIRRVQESSVWDEKTKEDKILRLNVKFYISNLIDSICREETNFDLSK